MRLLRNLFFMTGIVGLLLSTALVLMAKSVSVPSFLSSNAGSAPVDTDSCWTCHFTAHSDWSEMIDDTLEQAVSSRVHAAVADMGAGYSTNHLMEIGSAGRAYALEDTSFYRGIMHHPRYVMQTDRGYAVLPSQWDVPGQAWDKANPDNWRVNCTNCHAIGKYAGEITWSDMASPCVTCHVLDDSHPKLIPGKIEVAESD